MIIGILVTGHIDQPHVDNYVGYAQMFQQLFKKADVTFEYAVFNVIDDEWPQYIDSCDGWLITGSASGVYDNTPWMQKLKKWIIHSHEQNVPMVGICFGHQIIAEAFAGKVEKYSGGWGVGPHQYQLHNILLEGKSEIKLHAVHQDQVTKKPLNAVCLASSPFCVNAILAYGDTILTVQAHPEFTKQYAVDLLSLHQGSAISHEVADLALGTLKTEYDVDDLVVARWMARVFLLKA
ncbi:MAG: GMP synthase-like glutamine amidotransferase [Oceanicoccus sp.]|jgi:GMP synthase-like glutamine amidotransferase